MMWTRVKRCDPRAAQLADAHYSRQTVGAREFMPPGRVLVLLADGAVWGACENLGPRGARRWRVTIFRNEGVHRSSDLIREATAMTVAWWAMYYGEVPCALTTEVDPARVRRKRDPGRCFLRAGWRVAARDVGKRRLTVLEAA